MDFYKLSDKELCSMYNSNLSMGLSKENYIKNCALYGKNTIPKPKEKSIFSRIITILNEPMLIILLISFVITFGSNLGKLLKTGDGNLSESFGIFMAILLSVLITLFMEGSSERAFNSLNKIYDNINVKVIRNGKPFLVSQHDITCGDIVEFSSGDKIVADGRLIESNYLQVDESALTGESTVVNKDCSINLASTTPLADRVNSVFSGTYCSAGSGKMIVSLIGKNTEIGKIAGELSNKNEISPLNQKLGKLGKIISLIGLITALLVFILSLVKLISNNALSFDSIRELFMSCIILIVAAVPEGLPTIVALSLALNMNKLAKDNALIKKMTATETTGAVSVICSDKTGTLTENKMAVKNVCPYKAENINYIALNIKHNCSSKKVEELGKVRYVGNGTEVALLEWLDSSKKRYDSFSIISVVPFTSESKLMITLTDNKKGFTEFIKGAPEKVLTLCNLGADEKLKIEKEMNTYREKMQRVICFAHRESLDEIIAQRGYTFDGFMGIADPVRKDVKKAVCDCKRAGVEVKMLTGDNAVTAYFIALELGICDRQNQVVSAVDIERLDDVALKKILSKVKVIARSTPLIKLRIVKLLKEMGEVVAVTGDGVNDAPAIRQADVGIAMNSGSEITKETADIVLLNDSFSTVTKAISFGRNVYKNLQRFILFQLSVNLTALLFITICTILGFDSPFNTLQLLWINVIMDGPPALTLGLEPATDKLMASKPVKRSDGIVSIKMLAVILISGISMAIILTMQKVYNFLGAVESQKNSAIFTLFILLQLFNAFNCKTLGADSLFKTIGKNKIMLYTFIAVFILHVVIVEVFAPIFMISKMSLTLWFRCILTALSVVVISETYKFIYRFVKKRRKRIE